jgi:hypothetical protein
MTHPEFMSGIKEIFSQCSLGEIPWPEGAKQIHSAMSILVEEHPRLEKVYKPLLSLYENRPKIKWFTDKCQICGHIYQWDRQSFTMYQGEKYKWCAICAAWPKEKDESTGQILKAQPEWHKERLRHERQPAQRIA